MSAGGTKRARLSDFNNIPAAADNGNSPIHVRTAREFAALPDPPDSDLLLGPLVVRQFRTVIVGDTGHGKTTLALQMAAAVLDGRECLDQTGIGAGPVLVIDLEQGQRSIKRLLNETRLADHDDLLYAAVPDGLELDVNQTHKHDLERVIVNHAPVLVILDPYYKSHRADSNEERAVVDLMRFLDELRVAYGFSLMLPAHPRKTASAAPSGEPRKLELSDVFGSGAVTRGSELVLAIERISQGYARLRFLKDRDFDFPVGEFFPLAFSRDHGFTILKTHRQEDIEHLVLESDQEWRTAKEWSQHLKVRPATIGPVLRQLAESGRIGHMIGPPGRSPKANCYSTQTTIPEIAEQ